MTAAAISAWLSRSRTLATTRWRALATAVGISALLGAVAWFILLKVGGSIGGGTDADGLPSMGTIYASLAISWAVLVTAFATPLAAASAALTDADDAPFGWTRRALALLGPVWVRLALVTAPLLLLACWALRDLASVFTQAFEAIDAATPAAEPSEPLSFTIIEALFGSFPARAALFVVVLGLWMLWSATRATDQHERLVPHAPWRTFGRSPVLVAALAIVSAIVLGPVLAKALGQVFSGLGSIAGDAAGSVGAEGASTGAVLVAGTVISAFLGLVAIPWIALFSDAEAPTASDAGALEPQPQVPAEPTAGPMATAVQAAAAAPAMQQVSELTGVAGASAHTGAWWYLPAGSQALVQVASAPGIEVSPVASDAAGQWLQPIPIDTPGAARFAAGADGWYLLGAWNSSVHAANVAMRFTLPADAQPAPQEGVAG